MALVVPNRSHPREQSKHDSPLVTMLLVSYQQEAYIADAVRSALAQTYSPLQIVISDDCSTDATWDIIKRVCESYSGPHQIVLNRNPERLYIRHWRHIEHLLKGRYLVLGCGDDVFMPSRVSVNMEAFKATGASVLTSNCVTINDDGDVLGLFQDPNGDYDVSLDAVFDKGTTVMFHGASMAWDREAIDRFGPLPILRNIDWVIPFRGLLMGGNHYIKEPLMSYRMHSNNVAIGLKLIKERDESVREKLIEAQRCQRIINDYYMSADIAKLREIHPLHPRLSYLNEKINARMRASVGEWATLRVDWLMRGVGV